MPYPTAEIDLALAGIGGLAWLAYRFGTFQAWGRAALLTLAVIGVLSAVQVALGISAWALFSIVLVVPGILYLVRLATLMKGRENRSKAFAALYVVVFFASMGLPVTLVGPTTLQVFAVRPLQTLSLQDLRAGVPQGWTFLLDGIACSGESEVHRWGSTKRTRRETFTRIQGTDIWMARDCATSFEPFTGAVLAGRSAWLTAELGRQVPVLTPVLTPDQTLARLSYRRAYAGGFFGLVCVWLVVAVRTRP